MHDIYLPDYFQTESEWIVESGGSFFADKEATIPGFAKERKKDILSHIIFHLHRTVADYNADIPYERQVNHNFRYYTKE